jgi:hypothetical protein
MIKNTSTPSLPTPNKTFRVFGAVDRRYKYTIHNSRGGMVAYGYRTYEAALEAADKMLRDYKAKRKALRSGT